MSAAITYNLVNLVQEYDTRFFHPPSPCLPFFPFDFDLPLVCPLCGAPCPGLWPSPLSGLLDLPAATSLAGASGRYSRMSTPSLNPTSLGLGGVGGLAATLSSLLAPPSALGLWPPVPRTVQAWGQDEPSVGFFALLAMAAATLLAFIFDLNAINFCNFLSVILFFPVVRSASAAGSSLGPGGLLRLSGLKLRPSDCERSELDQRRFSNFWRSSLFRFAALSSAFDTKVTSSSPVRSISSARSGLPVSSSSRLLNL